MSPMLVFPLVVCISFSNTMLEKELVFWESFIFWGRFVFGGLTYSGEVQTMQSGRPENYEKNLLHMGLPDTAKKNIFNWFPID